MKAEDKKVEIDNIIQIEDKRVVFVNVFWVVYLNNFLICFKKSVLLNLSIIFKNDQVSVLLPHIQK